MGFSGCDAQFYGKTARKDRDGLAGLETPAGTSNNQVAK
jgi:hypothetical protein